MNLRCPKVQTAPADESKSKVKGRNHLSAIPFEWRMSRAMPVRALIIDDSAVMRKIVERSLRQAGIDLTKVLEAGNGAEALAVLNESAVDLILCDINMPIMDGIEFIKQLPGVANAKDAPVVMITTEGSEAHVVEALSCGARGYIRKPFTPEQVKEHVVPVLKGKS